MTRSTGHDSCLETLFNVNFDHLSEDHRVCNRWMEPPGIIIEQLLIAGIVGVSLVQSLQSVGTEVGGTTDK